MTPITTEQLISAQQWRHAVKAFDPARKIPDDTWQAIEQVLVLSPSSYGLQPYQFLVVTDSGLREQLVPHAGGQRRASRPASLECNSR